ncbi:MAG TPA: energy-coupling factor ABC transporter permease [Polyangiaceae bacterium]|jgi:cobalt/nickel transport system permease protein
MHLADGIVTQTAPVLALNVAGLALTGVAYHRAFRRGSEQAAWTGTLGAFALAAQALNVPVWLGTSAHVIGAGLLTLALGPARAIAALCAVLLVQALLLSDGGVTVLGINLLTIAILPALSMHACRRAFGQTLRGLTACAFAGTVIGSLLGSSTLAFVLVEGGQAPPGLTYGLLVGVQTAAGAVEGALTAVAVRLLHGRAPGILTLTPAPLAAQSGQRGGWKVFAVAALAVGALVPFASSAPDALERLVGEERAEPAARSRAALAEESLGATEPQTPPDRP